MVESIAHHVRLHEQSAEHRQLGPVPELAGRR